MAKRDYKLVSADSHLGLPPGFFQRYLPEQYRDHDWVRTIEAGSKQSLKMAGMGLGHMAGKRYEDFKEKDITEDDIRVGEFEPTARLKTWTSTVSTPRCSSRAARCRPARASTSASSGR